MKIQYSMAMEMIFTIFQLVKKDFVDSEYKRLKIEKDSQIFEIINKASDNLSPFLESDMNALFKDFDAHIYMIMLLIASKQIDSEKQLIKELYKMSSKEYYEAMIYQYDFDYYDCDISSTTPILDIVKCVEKMENKKHAKKLEGFLKYSETAIKKLSRFFDDFYKEVFLKINGDLKEQLYEILPKHQMMFEKTKDSFIKEVTNGTIKSDKNLEFIYVSYISDISFMFSSNSEFSMILYGSNYNKRYESLLSEDNIANVLKIISDPNRRKLIKLLSLKSYYGAELAKELEITTATLSYHISKLVEYGLVRLETNEGKRIYYQTDKEKLKQILNKTYQMLTEESL